MELATRLQNDVDDLRAQIAQKEETFVQQSATIEDLRDTISNQRNDIRSAMELVIRRPLGSAPHSSQTVQEINLRPCDPPIDHQVRTAERVPSPPNMHTHYHWHQKQHERTLEAKLCQAPDRLPVPCPFSQSCRSERVKTKDLNGLWADNTRNKISPIKFEMDKIDKEVAELDAALKAAALKFS